ncbi:MAG: NAD(+)/NADH kinase [Chloroflexi bacterium]|nr:NAD(+)/NADH kinase [Chloroflexota bacterium]
MSSVGIIANPASGRDIRRLVAHGSVFSNNEKVNIVRRVLLGLEAVGVERVICMPDTFRIGQRALEGLDLRLAYEELPHYVHDSGRDSQAAAAALRERGVGCIVTLGGDGTNRAVAKDCGDVPLLAVSTGTNNVFPVMIEGTVAGLAAGLVATGQVDQGEATYRTARLEIDLDGKAADVALVDAAVVSDTYVGARAIWEPARLRHLVLARAGLHYIGLSSIGGALYPGGLPPGQALYLELGPGGQTVTAPIAPGLIHEVAVRRHALLPFGERLCLDLAGCTVALDGERELEVIRPRRLGFVAAGRGPLIVDVPRTLALAARRGFFLNRIRPAP